MANNQINPELIGTSEALKIVQEIGQICVSLPTLISWIQKYNIGKMIGGRWWINKQQLTSMLIKGNPNAKAS